MKALEQPQHFPIITLRELSVAMESKVMTRSGPKLYVAVPHHNDASYKNLVVIGPLVAVIFHMAETILAHNWLVG